MSHTEDIKATTNIQPKTMHNTIPQLNYEMGIPRKVLPVKFWGCRSAELYEKIKIVGKGTFGYFYLNS